MIGVEEAQARLLALASPLPAIEVSVSQVVGHYLAEDVVAKRTQPATDLSAMDGYAIRFADLPGPWRVIGESAAGRPFAGRIDKAEAVRIFTGAHVPDGADSILIQEEASRDGDLLNLTGEGPPTVGAHIRRKGGDFSNGDRLLVAGTRLNAGAIAAAVMAGYGALSVGGYPKVSIIGSGDELLPPGVLCDDAHIPSSNSVMLAAMLNGLPCSVDDKGIVADNLRDLETSFRACAGSDIIVTSGGASVGDHDLVQQALRNIGAEIDFWKVAMRPGKPVMAGRLGNAIVLGLPGNPSSAFVTAFLFLIPLVRQLAGSNSPLPEPITAALATDLAAGGQRTDYFRARIENNEISMFNRQDSGMLAPLSQANALLINPAGTPPRPAGTKAQYLRID
jgi:molybdopterin molybdotransferase